MKCFYHSADLDGHCSGAVVKYRYPDCEMFGINYGDDFPYDKIFPGETVFMVDFAIQPYSDMTKLDNLIWIDHHVTAIQDCNPDIPGVRRVGTGACQLVWEFLYPGTPIPETVRLLAEYDVWDHSDMKTLPFQYGFRMFDDTLPDNQSLWKQFFLFNGIGEVLGTGRAILKYEQSQNKKLCKSFVFQTEFEGYNAVCINRGFTNSKVFDSLPETDLMITFCRTPYKIWAVSLYSKTVDCGAIAQKYGGGGHKGAAGFQCEEIPFEI